MSLLSKIDLLLKGPLEAKEGRIFIKSLNRFRSDKKSQAIELQDEGGNFIASFDSIADCIKYLGLGRNLVYKSYQKDQPVSFAGQLVYLKKVAK